MTLSPTCAVTPDTSKTDDSDFDDILAEILAEEEARVVKNPTSSIGQKKKVKRTKKKKPTYKKTDLWLNLYYIIIKCQENTVNA